MEPRVPAAPAASPPEARIPRLVLWNIDLTLLDVARVTRAAYADAFRKVTGRSLVHLPQMAGRTESEIFFDMVALNESAGGQASSESGESALGRFTAELAVAFSARGDLLAQHGRLLPGARESLIEVGRLPGVVQSVLTGSIKANAVTKLRAFGLAEFLDTDVGGYGSEVYTKGALLMNARSRATARYGGEFTENHTVYVADSVRDVDAARTGGARCLAVASGRSTVNELREAGADLVFDDLADAREVARAVDRLTADHRD